MQAKQFAIAKSSNGIIGLITSPEMVEITYPDNNKAVVWTGVIIEDNTFTGRGGDADKIIQAKKGGYWSSSNPEVIGYLQPEQMFEGLPLHTKRNWLSTSRENEQRRDTLLTPAVFTSVWEEGLVDSPCDVSLVDGEVVNIISADTGDDFENLVSQHISVKNSKSEFVDLTVTEEDDSFFVDMEALK